MISAILKIDKIEKQSNMGRYYYDKKEEANGLKRISVFKLKEWGYFDGRTYGTIIWTNNWSDSKSTVSIQVDLSGYNPFLRIWYTQTNLETDEKKDFDYHIPLEVSECNLGGKRYWFVCPWYRNRVHCGRRVAVLYKNGDRFACRHCYDLSYASKNENRRHYMFGFGQLLDLERKMEELEIKVKTRYYNGRPTRKYRKLLTIISRMNGIHVDSLSAHMEKRRRS